MCVLTICLFKVGFSCGVVKARTPALRCWTVIPFTAGQFFAVFDQICVSSDSTSIETEKFSSWFHSCQTILESVAPLKTKQPKTKAEPWFSDRTCTAIRECHRAKHSWKKDKLQVSFQILNDCWHNYQNIVKEAKTQHLPNIIASNHHNPCMLFKTLNVVLPQSACFEASPEICNNFSHFFIDKVVTTRALISAPVPCPGVFDQFELVTVTGCG